MLLDQTNLCVFDLLNRLFFPCSLPKSRVLQLLSRPGRLHVGAGGFVPRVVAGFMRVVVVVRPHLYILHLKHGLPDLMSRKSPGFEQQPSHIQQQVFLLRSQ